MSMEIGKARYTFDRFGYVPPGIISPMILQSWERSKHLPREARNPKLPPEELDKKLFENRDFLDAALPVEQLLYICSNRTMVGLSCSETYMIHEVCREKYLNQIGRGGQESVIGTTATNLCLREGIPVQTVRQENYNLRYQHCCFASAPVYRADRRAAGVISYVTTFGADLPANALLMVSHAAKLIEKRLASPESLPIMECGGVEALLDLSEHGIMLCDGDGRILTTNATIRKALGFTRSRDIIDRHIGELFDNDEEAEKVKAMLRDSNRSEELHLLGKRINCLYLEKFSSGQADGELFGALVFENASQSLSSGHVPGKRFITEAWIPSDSTASIVGESPEWQRVKSMIRKVASVRSFRVLIEGESGTGKEQIAKAIHAASGRKGKMITLNCGALPKELLQSELFGYVDGAFTGAKKGGNPGKFEMANGGTLFLDEIGEMPLDMQVSLLRVLEEKEVVRLGSSKPTSVDLSIIAATNKSLMAEVEAGNFRMDLYYRLSAVVISAPPLRERKSDIPLLVSHLINRLADGMSIAAKPIAPDAMEKLYAYDWPGNVRELLNVLEHALVMEEGDMITSETLSEVLDIRALPARQVTVTTEKSTNLRALAEKQKAQYIAQVVENCGGNISKAAKQLNVSRNTIYRYLGK